ncbi:hypothetical protein CIG2463D_0729 [Campylobacter iguaniorum]|uniref:Uncharacterized protein n=2 Tax=Campylobacter iguaniorum TaxID=1244531 RepID=A0A076FFE1_9BACT|nr:hypothetical protein CIG1485E_0728 [Campylobacter iguaniorum]ALV24309.1 hypothetical protein CIG2463D_0729 [Campylobacter iguaniorum]
MLVNLHSNKGSKMLVNNDTSSLNLSTSSAKKKEEEEAFEKFLETFGLNTQTTQNNSTIASSSNDESLLNLDVDKFREKLRELGASAFYMSFNLEKIEQKIEEKRKELEKNANLDSLSGEEKTKAIATIDKMLEDYKKELLKQLNEQSQMQKQASGEQNKNSLSSILAAL